MGHHRVYRVSFADDCHLLEDLRVLLERHRTRNEPGRRLTTAERRAWVVEMVEVTQRLRHALEIHVGPPDYRGDRQRYEVRLHQFASGFDRVQPIESDPDNLRPRLPYLQRMTSKGK